MGDSYYLISQFLEYVQLEIGPSLRVDPYPDDVKEHKGFPYFQLETKERVWSSGVFEKLRLLGKKTRMFSVEASGTHRMVVLCYCKGFLDVGPAGASEPVVKAPLTLRKARLKA